MHRTAIDVKCERQGGSPRLRAEGPSRGKTPRSHGWPYRSQTAAVEGQRQNPGARQCGHSRTPEHRQAPARGSALHAKTARRAVARSVCATTLQAHLTATSGNGRSRTSRRLAVRACQCLSANSPLPLLPAGRKGGASPPPPPPAGPRPQELYHTAARQPAATSARHGTPATQAPERPGTAFDEARVTRLRRRRRVVSDREATAGLYITTVTPAACTIRQRTCQGTASLASR